MFHCVILFALKPGISLDRVRNARTALQDLVETMPGVEHLTVTHNVAPDGGGFTWCCSQGSRAARRARSSSATPNTCG